MPGYQKYSADYVRSFSLSVPQYTNYEVKSWAVTKNGISKGQLGTYDKTTKKITIDAMNGDAVAVTADGQSHMYHAIWRSSTGKKWTTESSVGSFMFTSDASTYVNGVSEYPGLFPAKDDSGNSIPLELRYSDGSAAAWSDRLGPPSIFKASSGDEIGIGYLEPASITITGAKPIQRGMVIDYYGKGQDGYGYIKVHKPLTSPYNTVEVDYTADDSLAYPIQGRTYRMDSTTQWAAKTYLLEFDIVVTYENTANGTAYIRHVDRNGNPISGLSDRQETLELNKKFSSTSSKAPTGYKYAGYVKTTTGTIPTNFTSPTSGEYPDIASYDGSFKTLYLYYVYDLDLQANMGTIHVRHMVRAGPTGTYMKVNEETVVVPNLTDLETLKTLTADSSYGTYQGRNVNRSGYSDSVTSIGGSSISVSLSRMNNEAWVSFFYEKSTAFTADFDVTPSSIAYRDSFKLHPKNFVLNGCTYVGHYYKIERDGTSWLSDTIYGMTTDSSYTYSNYPSNIRVGTHSVYMKVITSCGTSDWIGPKPLTVTSPSVNNPPTFKGAFTNPGSYTATEQVIQGSYVDLRVWDFIDPDGDTVTFDGFDFASGDSWIQSISSNNLQWVYTNIRADVLGMHTVKASIHDEYGATASITIYLNVVPQNPIPVITGPTQVVEGRPVTPELSSASSFSYMGRAIDHSRDEWTNRKTSYNTIGTESIKLNVYDNIGLKSLEPAVYKLQVIPDLPPIAELIYNSPTVRNVDAQFKDTSYSPDGDKIVEHKVRLRYDSDNDGSFTDETAVDISLSAASTFSHKFTAIGKYQFEVYLKEDWGKTTTQTFDFEVVNDAPTVSFDITTESQKPIVITSIPVTASTIANSADWKNSNIDNESLPKAWAANVRTGALAHSPQYEDRQSPNYRDFPMQSANKAFVGFEANAIDVVSRDSTSYSVSSSCTEFYCSDAWLAPIYIKGNSFVETYYHRFSSDDYKMYINTPTTRFLKEYPLPNANWEWVVYVDYKSEVVWTYVRTYENYKNVNYYCAYKMDDLLSPSGKPYLTTSTAPSILKSGVVDTSTESMVYDNTNKTVTYYSWSDLNTVQRTEAYKTNEIAISGLFRSASMDYLTKDATSTNSYFDYIINSNTRSASRLSGASNAYGVYPYISPDGKYTNSGGLLSTSSNYSHIFTCPTSYGSVMYTTCGIYKWNWQTDGSMTLVKAANFATSGNYIPQNTVNDEFGNIYYLTQNGIMRIDILTGNEELVYSADLSIKDESDSSWSYSYPKYLKILSDDMLAIELNGWASSKTNSSRRYFTTLTVLKIKKPLERNQAKITEQQLLSKAQLSNAQYNFAMRQNNLVASRTLYAGFSFNAQDNRNMYRVEANANNVRLVRVDGGVRTVLDSKSYSFNPSTIYDFKIKALDNKITVYVGGAPLLEATDSTFGKGSFGPYSQIQKTEFLRISYSNLDVISSANKLQGIALVDTKMTYAINNEDTENDPMAQALTSWKYDQVSQKFLNAGDGKSGVSKYNGKSYTTPLDAMDKVGLYEVSYETTDDPNGSYLYPSNVFNDYRKKSNKSVRSLIVHRSPIVDYDVALNPDKTVKWTDRSYDPDRFLSATNYSTEDTGIDYKATRGILEKMFYYITPSGQTVLDKLVVASEIGTYTVGLAVKDEYNAWSTTLEKTIVVDALPTPNDPPVAGFTLSMTETYRNTPVTINSIAYDKEDGDRTHLPHAYYISNDVTGGLETLQSTVRTTWTKSFSSIGVQKIRQTVEDSLGQTASFTNYVNIINRIPAAVITAPASSDQNNPTKLTIAEPTFKWTYSDGDGDVQTKYQVKVYRYGGILEYESGIRSAASTTWTIDTALEEKTRFYVIVRVFDGFDWSEWSAPKFFYLELNRPPVAQFDWKPKPVWEGDALQLINQSSDPDGDAISSLWTIVTPTGNIRTYSETPLLANAEPGNYSITLEVSDGKLSGRTSSTIEVLPLSIEADVRHTEDWKKTHEREGHETTNNPKDFYAGEIIIANARPTAGVPVSQVTVKLIAIGLDGSDLTREWQMSKIGSTDIYAAELYDTKWASLQDGLPQGLYKLKFTVLYSNGTTKITTVPIQIIGSVYKAVGVHRRQ